MLEYQLIRSKRRKTLGLQVKAGRITVRAPFYVTTEFIDSFAINARCDQYRDFLAITLDDE